MREFVASVNNFWSWMSKIYPLYYYTWTDVSARFKKKKKKNYL